MTNPEWISNFKATPFSVFVHGYFWVIVFFILSGFVLPLRWFKTQKSDCVISGTFRRYLRLMLPYWVIISLYYLVVKSGWTSPKKSRLNPIKKKDFLNLIFDGLFGCWFGDYSYTVAAWTLSVELWSSFFVYLLA